MTAANELSDDHLGAAGPYGDTAAERAASVGKAFAGLLPEHKASLHLTHNDHLASYQTAEEAIAYDDAQAKDDCDFFNWVSDEQKQKARETGSIWTLQWYPDTPVGFCTLAASDLEAILEHLSPAKGLK